MKFIEGNVAKLGRLNGNPSGIAFLIVSALLHFCNPASALPTHFVGSGTYTVSVEGARPLDADGIPGERPFIHGTLFGDFTLDFLNIRQSSNPGHLIFDYVLDGYFTGILSKSGVEKSSSAILRMGGFGEYEGGPDSLISLGDGVVGSPASLVTLLYGTDQYDFRPDVFSMSPGIRPNGHIVIPATVNTLLPDGTYFFGIPELGEGGDPEVWLEGGVVATEVPEPSSLVLLGLSGIAVLRRKRA